MLRGARVGDPPSRAPSCMLELSLSAGLGRGIWNG
jgi:hypothetical protein